MTSEVFRLVFGTPSQLPVPVPPSDAPGVHVWRDADSRPIAWGHTEDGQHWMHWPGLASFRFTASVNAITAFPAPGARPDVIRDTWLRSVVPMALQALGREALHASAVLSPRGVVAFCAQSQTGKSTLAFGLARRGYSQWADDAVVIEMRNGSPVALPLPFRVRLRQPAASFYDQPDNRGSGSVTLPDRLPAPLAAVCILARHPAERPAGPVAMERLHAGGAFVALLTHAYCFNPADPTRRAMMLQHFLDISAAVPVFRLAFPADLTRLPALVDEAERLIDRLGADARGTSCAR